MSIKQVLLLFGICMVMGFQPSKTTFASHGSLSDTCVTPEGENVPCSHPETSYPAPPSPTPTTTYNEGVGCAGPVVESAPPPASYPNVRRTEGGTYLPDPGYILVNPGVAGDYRVRPITSGTTGSDSDYTLRPVTDGSTAIRSRVTSSVGASCSEAGFGLVGDIDTCFTTEIGQTKCIKHARSKYVASIAHQQGGCFNTCGKILYDCIGSARPANNPANTRGCLKGSQEITCSQN